MVMASSSWAALFHGERAVYTLLHVFGIGVHAISIHMLSTVLPSVVADVGGAAFYAWAMMLYTIASIIGTACGGAVKATWDIRRGYLLGGLVVLAGVIGCALAPHIAVFLGACAIQGSGCGLLVSLAYGMVSEFYPAELRPRVLSASSGMWGVAALLGPTIGGMFAGMGWWRCAFWAMVPVLVLLSTLSWYALPGLAKRGSSGRLPWLRLLLLGGGVVCLALSGRTAWLGLRVGLIGAALALMAQTFVLDRRASQHLFPSRPLALSTLVGTAVWMFILFGISTSQVTVFLPLVAQNLYGVSPLRAGYFTSLLSVAWTVTALAGAHLHERWVRVVLLVGPLLMTGGALGLGLVVGSGDLLWWSLGVACMGAGVGLCFAHLSSWAIAAAHPGEGALTAAAIPTIQSLGIAFGAALVGFIANAAGLATGISAATVTVAASWVYGLSFIAPTVLVILAIRLLNLQRQQAAGVRNAAVNH